MSNRTLILDIETAPNVAYVWGAWKQNIGQNQWVNKSHIMSFAAKWLDDERVIYKENRKSNDKPIVEEIYKLLDKADIVVAHNGKKFDLPTIIGRGVIHGLKPPSPYFVVDTLLVAREELRLVSNTLANLCDELGLPKKDAHKKYPGFELWLGCLRGEDEAWAEMKHYNIQDILSLEALYLRLRPYMRRHPNMGRGTDCQCPKCQSTSLQARGYYYTKAGLAYQRYVCNDCGSWSRDRKSEKDRGQNNMRVAF